MGEVPDQLISYEPLVFCAKNVGRDVMSAVIEPLVITGAGGENGRFDIEGSPEQTRGSPKQGLPMSEGAS